MLLVIVKDCNSSVLCVQYDKRFQLHVLFMVSGQT